MKIKAAVSRQAESAFTIEDVTLDAPRENEILVRIAGVGLCHTDLLARDMVLPIRQPSVLGHEGSGVVEAVGSAIESVKPGDHVVLTFAYCGSCRRCIEACPTGAISDGKVINGSQCISYYTIELKDLLLPDDKKGQFADWMFGCDVCQDVCPWNRFAQPTRETGFAPLPQILNFTTKEWESLTEEAFKQIFRHSPLKRAKYQGIQRNVKFLKG